MQGLSTYLNTQFGNASYKARNLVILQPLFSCADLGSLLTFKGIPEARFYFKPRIFIKYPEVTINLKIEQINQKLLQIEGLKKITV